MKKNFIIFIFAVLAFLFCFQIALAADKAMELQLEQPLGPLSLMTISGTSIGEYIKAIFGFGSAAVAALAIIMITTGGIKWIISAGEPGKIGDAKNQILKALLGLFIAMFAIFVLQTVSPGTVNFKSITPEIIKAQQCCKYVKDGKETYEFKTETECRAMAGGGTLVALGVCQGGTQPFNLSDYCGGKNPLDSCNASVCGAGDVVGLVSSPDGGLCKDTTKPNCCRKTGPIENCDASNYRTVCRHQADGTMQEYCASAGAGQPGKCFPKRPNGADCKEKIYGEVSGTLFGGGTDEVCASNKCAGLTAAGLNKCVPKYGTGGDNDFCDSNLQCKSGYFCACAGFSPTNVVDGPTCDTGTCTPRAPKGAPCKNWTVYSLANYTVEVAGHNGTLGGCVSNCCTDYILNYKPAQCDSAGYCAFNPFPGQRSHYELIQ